MRQLSRWPSRRSLVAGVLAVAFLAVPAGAHAAPSAGVALADGVVVDAARTRVYLMNPGGGIDAVDLATGGVLWTSEAASRPLLAVDGQLVAQRRPAVPGMIEIAVLDAGTGAERLAARIDLPAGVWGTVQDRLGRSFRTRAALAGGGVALTWDAVQTGPGALQGYLAAPEEGLTPAASGEQVRARAQAAAGPTRLTGAVRLDLASGRTAPLLAERAAVSARPYLDLVPGAGPADRKYASADGRHALASERAGGAGPAQRFRWTLLDRASGARLGTVERDLPVAPFLVVGAKVLYASRPTLARGEEGWAASPRQLRAVDLTTGRELWSRSLLDPEPQGPFPP